MQRSLSAVQIIRWSSSHGRYRLTIVRQSPGYWRVVIDNPPINLSDPKMFAELNVLMDDIEADADPKLVVFESRDDDFFMNHHDVENRLTVPDQPCAMPVFGNWPKFVTRLAQAPVISLVKGVAKDVMSSPIRVNQLNESI